MSAQNHLKQLVDEQRVIFERDMSPLVEIAATRAMTAEEHEKFTTAQREFDEYEDRITLVANQRTVEQRAIEWAAEITGSGAPKSNNEWRNLANGEVAAVAQGESFRNHPAYERALGTGDAASAAEANYGTLGAMVRALAVGGTGSALVPTTWSTKLIDLARAESVVGAAKATFIAMDAGTIKIGRQTGDPTAAFRGEGTVIAPSDPTFDSVTLEAKTLSAIVTGSIEWWQDTPGSDALVVNALAKAIAAKIDQVALYGGVTAGAGAINLPTPTNPRGVLATLIAVRAANVLGTAAANGTTPTVANGYWNEILDAVFTVRDANEKPTAIVWSSKLESRYARAVDTTGQPLGIPASLADVPRLRINSIPSYTKGTNATATDAFAGDWEQLLIGQRLGITLQPLPELYAAEGKFGVLATWRGDVALARPSAFAAYRALTGAA